jgi:hypothetical protein
MIPLLPLIHRPSEPADAQFVPVAADHVPLPSEPVVVSEGSHVSCALA